MEESALIREVCRTYRTQRALGHEELRSGLATFVRDFDMPSVWDANHVSGIRAATRSEVDALLGETDRHFADFEHREFLCDPLTPPSFEARLIAEGFRSLDTLQLVLEGELSSRVGVSPPLALRSVQSDADWQTLYGLRRLDHLESDEKRSIGLHSEAVSLGLHEASRRKQPQMQYFLARFEGEDCGYGASVVVAGSTVGMVEDLFVRRDVRHRGIATALIDHTVRDARRRGAEAVLIGGLVDDTPLRMYAAMGFRPVCVTRSYVRDATVSL
jgi:GNAT superfamily N-acetyltransferase